MKTLHTRLHILKPLLLIAAALLPVAIRAQGDALLTQFWAVPTYYNPGAAGDTDNIRLRGAARLQWMGIEKAPRTFLATADTPFKFLGRKFGAGLVVQQESLGLFNNMTINAQFGYKFKLLKGVMTASIQAGFLNEKFRGSEVFIPSDDDYHQDTDEAIPNRDVAGNALDLGVGIYYVHPRFRAGLSLLHANNPTVTFTSEGESGGPSLEGGASGEGGMPKKFQFSAPRTAYFTAESNIPVKNTLFELLPSVLVRTDFTFVDVAVSARVRYNKLFTAGLAYRLDDAVSLQLGAEIKGIFIGYAYDYLLSDIAKMSSGSHELVAGYNLKLDFSEKNRNKHKSIRIM